MAVWELFADGSCKNKVGYFGFVLFKDNTIHDWGYGMVGQNVTPLEAEKWALSNGLDCFVRRWDEAGPLRIRSDSKTVLYSIEKDPDIGPKIKTIRGWGAPVVIKWVARDKNTLAHDLARTMIDSSRIANPIPEDLKG